MTRRCSFAPMGALVLLCCLWMALPAWGAPPDMVEVDAPARAGTGKPFLVRIASWYPLEDLVVEWEGRTVRPALTVFGGRTVAPVLLGADLRAETGPRTLTVTARIWGHERRFSRTVEIVESAWQEETLTVPPKMIDPPESERPRIERERELMRAARETVSSKRYWTLPFTRPVKGKMLSRFGLHRVFNGTTAGRHTGLDFRAWLGTPLHAVAAGRVVLTGRFYYAGNVVFIDHGNGLVTMSCHMSKRLVKEGDLVEAGQTIGLSGATGRVTGAHLHLAAFVMGAVVDPEALLKMDKDNLFE